MDGGPGIIVTGVLLTANSECVVAVSSLNEGECSKEDPPPIITSVDGWHGCPYHAIHFQSLQTHKLRIFM